ncbi:glycoside hydrolase family 9 protein [Ruegeria sp. R14_0]|uniref:glycoside hydrolase family 9 protein n=1 Tax=Ruegeria sp. R14_0 TaxID=2821100 RepID=UPI001ADA80A3|nr:glycoside hydrolase family 9 protein [Ruegeria sp. R14_0]MBO9445911.1 glycoside hydrolase family 9 protein [Ruegeria sp. R14_0]
MKLSRRVLLLQGTAVAATAPFAQALVSVAAAQEVPEAAVGFIGDNTLQVTLIDTVFDESASVPVSPEDRVRWRLDPSDPFGSSGKLNRSAGNFSGDLNVTEPQVFTAWPAVVKSSQLNGFRQGHEDQPKLAQADHARNWQITVDGAPAGIVSLYRKTAPIRTRSVGVREWDSTKRHMLTFELDRAIPMGSAVRIEGPSINAIEHNKTQDTFSEALHVCQLGYPISGSKKGYVGGWWGHDANGSPGNTDALLSENTSWRVLSVTDGAEVLSGHLTIAKPAAEPHRKDQNFNGCDIYEADFTGLDHAGEYRLQVDGMGVSFPFEVSATPYDEALRLAARWYYHQRSGCAITEPFGEGRTRPRNGHPQDGLTVWQTDVKLGDTGEGFGKAHAGKELMKHSGGAAENPGAWGGWHDAGDWDRRIQHMDAVYHMADLVESFEHIRALNLNIPESGKPFAHPDVRATKGDQDQGDGNTVLPDLIHEALWGISLWRRTQGADGAIIGGVEYSASGILGSVSWNPAQTTYAYGPEPWAAYKFAYGAAKLGHVVKATCGDSVLGEALIDEALQAWRWAESQASDEPHEVVSRARVAAAAPVYRASADASAGKVFEDHNPFDPQSDKPIPGIKKDVLANAGLDYVQAGREGRPTQQAISETIKGWIKTRALNDKRMGRDFGLHNTDTYPWGRGWLRFGPGSNWRANHFALYYAANRKMPQQMLDAAVEGMWFGLGCNPANVSFVQGLGHRTFADPLLTDPMGTGPIPGQISFGVAGGKMHGWEKRKTAGAFYPFSQDDWPIYTQVFESRSIAISAEHGMKSNAMEWLIACAVTTSG